MGKVLSKILNKLSADGPKRILMLGLDNAGIMMMILNLVLIDIYHR